MVDRLDWCNRGFVKKHASHVPWVDYVDSLATLKSPRHPRSARPFGLGLGGYPAGNPRILERRRVARLRPECAVFRSPLNHLSRRELFRSLL